MVSAGVSIARSAAGAHRSPTSVMAAPAVSASITEVCTVRPTSS